MEEKTSIKEIEKAAAEKAWELARIILEHPTRSGMTYEDIVECFGIAKVEPTTAVFRIPYEEAREKYDTWIKKHGKEIRIGDEVELKALGVKMVVTKIVDMPPDYEFGPSLFGISSDGSVYTYLSSDVIKTGNHWDYLDEYCQLDGWPK